MRHVLLLFSFLVSLGAASAQPLSPTERSMEQQGLVNIKSVVPDLFVSLMYARSDNFVGRVLYADLRNAYLLPETAEALRKAQEALRRQHPELSLKVYDATRPMRVQRQMWDVVKGTSKHIYVSNPARGGGLHNYGLAVDLTLCWARTIRDAKGKVLHEAGDTAGLSMGTPIDYLGKLAHVRDEEKHLRARRLTPEHLKNRRILRQVMSAGGFKVLATEWWHFNFKTRAQAKAHYSLIR